MKPSLSNHTFYFTCFFDNLQVPNSVCEVIFISNAEKRVPTDSIFIVNFIVNAHREIPSALPQCLQGHILFTSSAEPLLYGTT